MGFCEDEIYCIFAVLEAILTRTGAALYIMLEIEPDRGIKSILQ
jgi:hypothetical protein